MDFINEDNAVNGLADAVIKGGVCLFNAIKYIYSIAEEDFYRVSIKDALKIVLNNVNESDRLRALGLRIDENTCGEMQKRGLQQSASADNIQHCHSSADAEEYPQQRRRLHDRRSDTQSV